MNNPDTEHLPDFFMVVFNPETNRKSKEMTKKVGANLPSHEFGGNMESSAELPAKTL